jgi:hypothetical protein
MNSKFSRVTAVAMLWAFAGVVSAAESGISYDNINVSVDRGKVFLLDFDAVTLAGSTSITDSVFAYGSYRNAETDKKLSGGKLEATSYAIGLGWHTALAANTDFVVGAQYLRGGLDFMRTDEDTNGYNLDVGIRSMLTERFELAGFLSYADMKDFQYFADYLPDEKLSANVSVIYYVTPRLGISASFTEVDKKDRIGAGIRYAF